MTINYWRAFLRSHYKLLQSAFSPCSERVALLFQAYVARKGLQLLTTYPGKTCNIKGKRSEYEYKIVTLAEI